MKYEYPLEKIPRTKYGLLAVPCTRYPVCDMYDERVLVRRDIYTLFCTW